MTYQSVSGFCGVSYFDLSNDEGAENAWKVLYSLSRSPWSGETYFSTMSKIKRG